MDEGTYIYRHTKRTEIVPANTSTDDHEHGYHTIFVVTTFPLDLPNPDLLFWWTEMYYNSVLFAIIRQQPVFLEPSRTRWPCSLSFFNCFLVPSNVIPISAASCSLVIFGFMAIISMILTAVFPKFSALKPFIGYFCRVLSPFIGYFSVFRRGKVDALYYFMLKK